MKNTLFNIETELKKNNFSMEMLSEKLGTDIIQVSVSKKAIWIRHGLNPRKEIKQYSNLFNENHTRGFLTMVSKRKFIDFLNN